LPAGVIQVRTSTASRPALHGRVRGVALARLLRIAREHGDTARLLVVVVSERACRYQVAVVAEPSLFGEVRVLNSGRVRPLAGRARREAARGDERMPVELHDEN
jgi:hypothetical protein